MLLISPKKSLTEDNFGMCDCMQREIRPAARCHLSVVRKEALIGRNRCKAAVDADGTKVGNGSRLCENSREQHQPPPAAGMPHRQAQQWPATWVSARAELRL